MPANTEFLKAAASMIKKTLPRATPRSPQAKLTFTDLSPEDCQKLLALYESRPKHSRSALSLKLERLEPGYGFSVEEASLPSIKSSVGKFSKTTGRTYRVFSGTDNESNEANGDVIVFRTE
jgi:hypothetical protein